MRSLIPIAVACACVLGLALVWLLLMRPASNDLQAAVARVRAQTLPVLDERLGDLASQRDADALKTLRDLARRRRDEAIAELKDIAMELEQWFPQLGAVAPGEDPKRDDFAQKYAFGQDQLRRDIRAEVGRIPACQGIARRMDTVPLIVPAFQGDDRLPNVDELRGAQRNFNIQRRVLLAAARGGALPAAPPRVLAGWNRPGGTRGPFVEDKVELKLVLPPERLPAVLRSLIELGAKGPVCRLGGLATRPLPAPDDLGEDESPAIEAQVSLILTLCRIRTS